MREARLEPPEVSGLLLSLFSGYVEWYLRRNFHALRLAGRACASINSSRAVLAVLNHPSWWDPLIALTLAMKLFPHRRHFAPIESSALARYAFFSRIGFFGVEPGTASGASVFLRTGASILSAPGTMLWVTAQGHFADPRVRPVVLRSGTGHLVHRLQNVSVLPVALEYPFWQERFPEALVRLGEPLTISDGSLCSASEWTGLIASALETVQDRLAVDAVRQDISSFEIIAAGRTGTGVYDVFRALRAALRGQRFHSAHGSERL